MTVLLSLRSMGLGWENCSELRECSGLQRNQRYRCEWHSVTQTGRRILACMQIMFSKTPPSDRNGIVVHWFTNLQALCMSACLVCPGVATRRKSRLLMYWLCEECIAGAVCRCATKGVLARMVLWSGGHLMVVTTTAAHFSGQSNVPVWYGEYGGYSEHSGLSGLSYASWGVWRERFSRGETGSAAEIEFSGFGGLNGMRGLVEKCLIHWAVEQRGFGGRSLTSKAAPQHSPPYVHGASTLRARVSTVCPPICSLSTVRSRRSLLTAPAYLAGNYSSPTLSHSDAAYQATQPQLRLRARTSGHALLPLLPPLLLLPLLLLLLLPLLTTPRQTLPRRSLTTTS